MEQRHERKKANSQCAAQHALPHEVISHIIVRCLDSLKCILAIFIFSVYDSDSVGDRVGLSHES